MRAFACACGQLLFFENSKCLRCSADLGFIPDRLEVAAIEPVAGDPNLWVAADDRSGPRYRRCGRTAEAACNWLVPEQDPVDACASCRLTASIPAGDAQCLHAFGLAETAKRRLHYQLLDLGLPVSGRDVDPQLGLGFVLGCSTPEQPVMTGHASGVITLDLSESDSVHRERMRTQFGEPYRTVLGHFRHEIGHYYWALLVENTALHEPFRALFGDERIDYAQALQKNYSGQPTSDWTQQHVSSYAASHPWEDWAETFAHYLHIRDTMQTAAAFGLSVQGPKTAAAVPPRGGKFKARLRDDIDNWSFDKVVADWLALVYALNAVNRGMGKDDLYPFVLAPRVIEKLDFVHRLVREVQRRNEDAPSGPSAAEGGAIVPGSKSSAA